MYQEHGQIITSISRGFTYSFLSGRVDTDTQSQRELSKLDIELLLHIFDPFHANSVTELNSRVSAAKLAFSVRCKDFHWLTIDQDNASEAC